jgi:hypothetical protein
MAGIGAKVGLPRSELLEAFSAGACGKASDLNSDPLERLKRSEEVMASTANLRACRLLLGHTKLESTVRYLGIVTEWLKAKGMLR